MGRLPLALEKNMKLSFRLLLLPAMISLLTACGEESSTLSDPKVNNDSETTTTCQDKDYCIATQFLDEPVVGLNYRCNAIEGVTDQDGLFLCPNNSIATFFLKSTNGLHQIELGKYRVKTLGNPSDGTPLPLNLIATPQDLVTETNGALVDNKQLTNILRLLQALDSDGHTSNRAINRIVIDSKDKFAIDKLSQDISISQLGVDNFDELLKPMFDQLSPKSLTSISASQALSRFQDSLTSINAGIYEVVPTLARETDKVYTGMFGSWINSNLRSIVSMFFLIDRDGKTIGNALEWQKDLTETELENTLVFNNLIIQTTPKDLFFSSSGSLFSSKGVVTNNFVLSNTQGDKIKVTRGVLNKSNISSGDVAYRKAYGLVDTQSVDQTQLGAWQRENQNGTVQITSGTMSLQKTRTPNMYLDSTYWRTKDNVVVGEKPIFPLHLKMTVRDSNQSTACTNLGCVLGEMGITILANGNIITDRNNDCSDIDPITLKDMVNTEEQRLGFIASVLVDRTQQSTGEALIAPVMLVGDWASRLPSSDPWYRFYGLYLGAISAMSGGPKVQIDITRATSGIVTITNQQDERDAFGEIAIWSNYINYFRYLSETDTDKKKNLAYLMMGAVTSISPQTCYNPQPKI